MFKITNYYCVLHHLCLKLGKHNKAYLWYKFLITRKYLLTLLCLKFMFYSPKFIKWIKNVKTIRKKSLIQN